MDDDPRDPRFVFKTQGTEVSSEPSPRSSSRTISRVQTLQDSRSYDSRVSNTLFFFFFFGIRKAQIAARRRTPRSAVEVVATARQHRAPHEQPEDACVFPPRLELIRRGFLKQSKAESPPHLSEESEANHIAEPAGAFRVQVRGASAARASRRAHGRVLSARRPKAAQNEAHKDTEPKIKPTQIHLLVWGAPKCDVASSRLIQSNAST